MTPIIQALSSGYGEEAILHYLSKAAPTLARSISKARGSGYSVSNILGFLNKTMQDDEFDPYLSQEASHKKVQERRSRITKEILKTGAVAAGSYGAARALPAVIQGAKGIFGKGPGPAPMSNAPVTPPQIPPAGTSSDIGLASTTQSTPTPSAPEAPKPPSFFTPKSSVQIIEEMGIGPQIKNLQNAGNNPEQIAAAIGVGLKPNQRKWLDLKIKNGEAKPIPDMISDYLSNEGQRAESIGKLEKTTPEFKEFASKQLEQDKAKPLDEMLKKFEKGSIISTPDGNVGFIKDIKQKEALVDEDGKVHKLKIKDLQFPNETVRQTVARLLEMPEMDKSALINYWSYDPRDKQLFLMFHNGETYKYFDVPEELEQDLLEAAVSPKTKGENEFGAWSQEDPSSRGATFIQKLIAHPKYKKPGKGQPENPYYRKLRKGYDYWSRLRKE